MIAKWGLVIFTTVALLGAVGAWAASITVGGVDNLGSGSADVVAPAGIEVTDVEWVLFSGDTSKVEQAKVTFTRTSGGTDCAGSADGCTLRMILKSGATVLKQKLDDPFVLSATVGNTLLITWNLNGINCVDCPSASAIDTFAVTIVDPE